MVLFGKKKLPMEAVMSYQPPSIDGEPMPIPQQAAMPQLDSMGRKPLTKTQKMLGILADGLAGFAGTTPQFAPMMQRERDEENQFRYAGQLREQQRAQGREDKMWEWQNAPPAAKSDFDRALAAGNYTDEEIVAKNRAMVDFRTSPAARWGMMGDGTPFQYGGAGSAPLPFAGWGDKEGGPASPAPVNFPGARR